ncbi:MAG TPA: YdeI/OmpD-associated family protein, partial [Lacibacter sp.]|nr:YdeI/OmpD-associated family protein [Lacibacter sp.]
AAVLESDPEAEALFRKLTPGNQRGLLYLVTRLRSSEKRIERSLHIAEKMKAGITSPRAM